MTSTKRNLAALALLAAAGNGSAAPVEEPAALAPNATVERLLKVTSSGEPLVELRGYVGPGPADQLRLYDNLDLATYVDVPRDAVVASSVDELRKDGVRVHVRAATPVVWSTRRPAGMRARTSGRALRGRDSVPSIAQAPSCGSVGQVCAGHMLMDVYECVDGLATENYYVQVGSC